MSISPSAAIVILNWNGKKYLEKFLPSVMATTYRPLRVIVADNASSDDSISFLETTYPEVEIILLSRNYGFAGGYNEALKQVDADYFVLLNSDVEVQGNWLEPVLEMMEQQKDVAACQPRILAWNDKSRFEYAGAAGGYIDLYGYPFCRGRVFDHSETDQGQYNDLVTCFWASGAALVIRSHLFREAGGFDPWFFAHMEEIDLCWRLQLMGYRVCCHPESIVYHVGGGTLPQGNSRKTFLNFRNNQIMMAKNLPVAEKIWKIPFRFYLDQVAALKALLSGDGGYFLAVLKAHLAFLYWLLAAPAPQQKHRRKQLGALNGVLKKSLVWQFFVKKKKTFSELQKNSF